MNELTSPIVTMWQIEYIKIMDTYFTARWKRRLPNKVITSLCSTMSDDLMFLFYKGSKEFLLEDVFSRDKSL